MDIVTPNIGLLFWTAFIFGIVLVLLGAFAWKPILKALRDREQTIADSLNAAKRASEEASQVSAANEKQLQMGREEVNKLMAEAKSLREKMIADAKLEAEKVSARELANARAAIQQEKNTAMAEVKNLAAQLSVDIAEKILKQKFQDHGQQEAFAKQSLNEVTLN